MSQLIVHMETKSTGAEAAPLRQCVLMNSSSMASIRLVMTGRTGRINTLIFNGCCDGDVSSLPNTQRLALTGGDDCDYACSSAAVASLQLMEFICLHLYLLRQNNRSACCQQQCHPEQLPQLPSAPGGWWLAAVDGGLEPGQNRGLGPGPGAGNNLS